MLVWVVGPNLLLLEFIVGATEKATGFGVFTTGASSVTCAGVDIFKAVIVGGVTFIFIVGALGVILTSTSGIVIIGAVSGVFTFGSTTGAFTGSTVGSATLSETASFFTSKREDLPLLR